MIQKYYIVNLFNDVPYYIYEGLISIFFASVVLILGIRGLKNGWRNICLVLLIEYIILLLCNTVIFRESVSVTKFNFHPFWTYEAIRNGIDYYITMQIIMNIVVFVPIGLLGSIAFKDIKCRYVVLVALCLSMLIEALQFFFKKGLSEIDDVMHNLVGCIIGIIVLKSIILIRHYSHHILISLSAFKKIRNGE